MYKRLYYIFKLLRPRQWIKNVALFASIVFGGQLFQIDVLTQVIIGFISFCFLSSSTYIINDIVDVNKDRLHPFKKARPIAAGAVTVKQATITFVITITVALFLAKGINDGFFLMALLYLIIQMLYSSVFKSVVIFDIFFIALGYILRVYAGELITGYHISVWLLLSTISISLFLAIAKRRSELTLLRSYKGTRISEIRKSLSHYSEALLDAYTVIFATSTLIFYSLFTFLENPGGVKISLDILLPDFLPYYLQRKWLMLTIIPVVYGLMRYLQDIYEKHEGESPDRVILSDKPLLASVLIWGIMTIVIIYSLG
ncbi:MAG TPA: UbiA prenyltransferase family protein [Patescibacteria group bacterium]|nr:UbiA prenyltransferase family protein [Patescibacteria group bacterium]